MCFLDFCCNYFSIPIPIKNPVQTQPLQHCISRRSEAGGVDRSVADECLLVCVYMATPLSPAGHQDTLLNYYDSLVDANKCMCAYVHVYSCVEVGRCTFS